MIVLGDSTGEEASVEDYVPCSVIISVSNSHFQPCTWNLNQLLCSPDNRQPVPEIAPRRSRFPQLLQTLIITGSHQTGKLRAQFTIKPEPGLVKHLKFPLPQPPNSPVAFHSW